MFVYCLYCFEGEAQYKVALLCTWVSDKLCKERDGEGISDFDILRCLQRDVRH